MPESRILLSKQKVLDLYNGLRGVLKSFLAQPLAAISFVSCTNEIHEFTFDRIKFMATMANENQLTKASSIKLLAVEVAKLSNTARLEVWYVARDYINVQQKDLLSAALLELLHAVILDNTFNEDDFIALCSTIMISINYDDSLLSLRCFDAILHVTPANVKADQNMNHLIGMTLEGAFIEAHKSKDLEKLLLATEITTLVLSKKVAVFNAKQSKLFINMVTFYCARSKTSQMVTATINFFKVILEMTEDSLTMNYKVLSILSSGLTSPSKAISTLSYDIFDQLSTKNPDTVFLLTNVVESIEKIKLCRNDERSCLVSLKLFEDLTKDEHRYNEISGLFTKNISRLCNFFAIVAKSGNLAKIELLKFLVYLFSTDSYFNNNMVALYCQSDDFYNMLRYLKWDGEYPPSDYKEDLVTILRVVTVHIDKHNIYPMCETLDYLGNFLTEDLVNFLLEKYIVPWDNGRNPGVVPAYTKKYFNVLPAVAIHGYRKQFFYSNLGCNNSSEFDFFMRKILMENDKVIDDPDAPIRFSEEFDGFRIGLFKKLVRTFRNETLDYGFNNSSFVLKSLIAYCIRAKHPERFNTVLNLIIDLTIRASTISYRHGTYLYGISLLTSLEFNDSKIQVSRDVASFDIKFNTALNVLFVQKNSHNCKFNFDSLIGIYKYLFTECDSWECYKDLAIFIGSQILKVELDNQKSKKLVELFHLLLPQIDAKYNFRFPIAGYFRKTQLQLIVAERLIDIISKTEDGISKTEKSHVIEAISSYLTNSDGERRALETCLQKAAGYSL